MLEKLEQIKETALAVLAKIEDAEALNKWKVTHLGRSSAIMDAFKSMGSIPKEARGMMGRTCPSVSVRQYETFETRASHSKDAMGMGTVYYAPR